MEYNITVLYEDDDILAINKPAGLIVHADGKNDEPSVVNWVLEHYPKIRDVGEAIVMKDGRIIDRPGIVHRLDRDTSGVLLIAKTKESFSFLKHLFKTRGIQKVYRAFVIGILKDDRGIIERSIKRSKTDHRKWTAYSGRGQARPAITQYRVLKKGVGMSYLELRPKTGRTHQIRVHLLSLGHPVIADTLYGKGHEAKLGFKRHALHALSLSFTDKAGKPCTITAPLPQDFIDAEKAFADIAK